MATKIIMTDGTKSEILYNIKTINPFSDERPGVWTPDNTDVAKQARSNRLVPSVFAGISARMQAMSDLPFTIYSFKGDKTIDDSDDYKNKIGMLPYPSRFMSLSEGALVTAGRTYWFKGTGTKTGQVKELKYWMPTSVTLDADTAKKGKINFRRTGVNDLYPAEQVLYFWGIDPSVELGPPMVWPLESAITAAEANGAITKWVADYMRRGAVKAMLLMMDGMPPPDEVDRMESWFNKIMTGAIMRWKVFSGAGVKPTIVGDGLEALKDLAINKDLRYDIHQALGTRHLLEDENFATAQARERQFYTITIVPDARLIQYGLNEQILHAAGFHIEFEPERLECFQEDEGAQADSFLKLFEGFEKFMSVEAAFQLASEKLDYQFTDEQTALIKKGIADKQKSVEVKPVSPVDTTIPAPPEIVKALVELDKWQDKVSKAGKMVTWHAVAISPEMVKAIKASELTFEQARAQINNKPSTDTIILAESINKLAERLPNVQYSA